MTTLDLLVEHGRRRVFVSVLDWPGWCRSAKTVEDALETCADYQPRFAAAMKRESLRVPIGRQFRVIQTVAGNATTDFGAPDARADIDVDAMAPAAIKRHLACLSAAWATLDEVVADAPSSLRRGPRGGGRDRDAVVAHVANAERAYARKVGVRAGPQVPVAESREALLKALREGAAHEYAGTGWPIRYAIRRITWHVLDHAWEIEDKSSPLPTP